MTSVNHRVAEVVAEPIADLPGITSDSRTFIAPAQALLTGGKRARARLAALGWLCVRPESELDEEALVMAGSALELFQGAALIHDDVIDAADTRRGAPSTHRAFQADHRERGRRGDAAAFGVHSAILLGDLLLALSYREITRAVQLSGAGARDSRAQQIWDEMTAEVAIGQYLDIEAATLPLPGEGDAAGHQEAIDRAMAVLRHKSAHYSVAHPLALGAALAGAPEELFAGLAAIGGPLGEAFQLRDDDLGIFGNPSRTGKPAGDDLMEGKRTPLVLLGLARTEGSERAVILASLGNRDLTPGEAERIRGILTDGGAVAAHEEMIAVRRDAALDAIDALATSSPAAPDHITAETAAELRAVVETLTHRDQ